MSYLSFLKDALNYDERVVGRIEPEDNCGVGVSTCFTSDEGYETAILDANGAHPVQRYKTKEEAERGHNDWVARAPKLKQIIKLGLSNSPFGKIKNKKYKLKK